MKRASSSVNTEILARHGKPMKLYVSAFNFTIKLYMSSSIESWKHFAPRAEESRLIGD